MSSTVIGRGTWIDKLAAELVDREMQYGRSLDILRVESGLGASGVPHLGSLGDAVRSYGVKLALEDMGYDSALVAYSDDMDGLRKVPEGFPSWLDEHLAEPVSMIEDPHGCYDSYGSHMSSILLDGLDGLGIQYDFRRAYDTYRSGMLADQIHTLLTHAQTIGRQISDMVGQDKYVDSLPYFAVCSNCNKLYTTNAYHYDPVTRRVHYECQGTKIGTRDIPGCGHRGVVDIDGGLGKLAWKVEFAARWSALDVRFEAYGKDIMDSVKVNDWIAEHILGVKPPYHVRYEMFLDRGGRKISKSLGNVVTAQDWLAVGTPQSLLLLLYKRIRGARHLDIQDVPLLMNEYQDLEDAYFGNTPIKNEERRIRLRGLYEYANLLRPPQQPGIRLNYTLLVELARMFPQDRERHISTKLAEYRMPVGEDADDMIKMACRFADRYASPEMPTVEIDDTTRKALEHLVGTLDDADTDPQTAIYDAAKSASIRPRDLFLVLYRMVLGTTSGPRLGPLISDMGRNRVAATIRASLEGQ